MSEKIIEKTLEDSDLQIAKDEVSRIITAYAEGWNEQRWEFHVARLKNIFQLIRSGSM